MIYLFMALSLNCFSQERIVGKTYPILEPNPFDEIATRAAKIDIEQIGKDAIKKQAFIKQLKANTLPRTTESTVRTIIPQAKAFADIYGPNGAILYPKGFTFNPLEYRSFIGRIIVMDQEDIGLFEVKRNDTVIINEGDIRQSINLLGQPAFILDKLTASSLTELRAVPTIIEQDGATLLYKEIKSEVNPNDT